MRHFQLRRQAVCDCRQRGANPSDNVESRGTAGFQNGLQDAALTVAPGDIGLEAGAVVDVGDVPQINHGAVHDFHGHIVQLGDGFGAAIQFDVVLAVSDLGRALWDDQVLTIDCVRDVGARKSPLQQPLRIKIDTDQPVFPAVGSRKFGTFYVRQPDAQEVDRQIKDLLLGERLAAHANLQNGHVGSAVGHHEGRRRARGHETNRPLRRGRYLRHARVHVGARLKEYLDDRGAAVGLCLHVFDVADHGRQRTFEIAGEPILHILRRQAVVLQDHTDDGNVDGREDVGGRLVNGHAAQNDDEHR